jgi:molybdate transport system substrate-binding protein
VKTAYANLRICALLLAVLWAPPTRAADVTVFAAASLSDALRAAATAYTANGHAQPTFSFAASSTLARQIEASGGADIFISADRDWMDYLDKKKLLVAGTRKDLLGNRLVLIGPSDSGVKLKIAPHFDLFRALAGGRLAVADPASVPAGRYAKAALKALGAWDSVAGALAPAENVRAALAYVARGEAPLGIVYATDAYAEPRVRIVDTFPEASHPPIVYPIALVKGARANARGFLAFLEGPQASRIFVKSGFRILP